MNWIDIAFLITVVLLVLNGLRNGALFSLINLLSIPIAFVVADMFGPQFTALLAANRLAATPLISYAILFLGTVFILHLIGSIVRRLLKYIPLFGQADSLLGGVIGFVEAWLLWLLLLFALGSFLTAASQANSAIFQNYLQNLHIQVNTLQQWHDFYNQTVTQSLFAKVNSFFVKELPQLPIVKPLP